MKRHLVLVVLASLLVGLTACQKPELDIFIPVLDAHEVSPGTATLVIKRLSDDKVWVSNPARAKTRYVPASTSKIPHTLIALETKTAAPDTVFKWDGTERIFKQWNQDQTFTQAYQRSAVWVFQEVTQELGQQVMRDWLSRFHYGNHDIGHAGDLTTYWLRGPLKISANEQVDFLENLATHMLPVNPHTYADSWPMFVNEVQGAHTLYAKSGWKYDEKAMDIGWFVGWVETGEAGEVYAFALNMDMPEQSDVKKRKPIVMDALKLIGAWPQ